MSNYALRDKNLHYKIQEQAYNLVANDYRNKKIAGKDAGKKNLFIIMQDL